MICFYLACSAHDFFSAKGLKFLFHFKSLFLWKLPLLLSFCSFLILSLVYVVAAHLIYTLSLLMSPLFFPIMIYWNTPYNDVLLQLCPPIHEFFLQLFHAYYIDYLLGFICCFIFNNCIFPNNCILNYWYIKIYKLPFYKPLLLFLGVLFSYLFL